MRQVTAAELRQSVGRIARALERTGEPILLKMGQRPVAVLITLKDFKERFALKDAETERKRLVAEILADARPAGPDVDRALEELRDR